jgi:predicted small lipoprotein YifL
MNARSKLFCAPGNAPGRGCRPAPGVVWLLLLLSLGGCGNKGPLYLPAEDGGPPDLRPQAEEPQDDRQDT